MVDFEVLDLAGKIERLCGLGRAALGAWGVDGNTAVLRLIKYRENAVFEVKLTSGPRYVLRIHRLGYHSEQALRSELMWIEALHQDGVVVPRVIPTLSGELLVKVDYAGVPNTRYVDLFEWIDGVTVQVMEAKAKGDVEIIGDMYRRIGRIAGALHNQSERWALPQGFVRHAWDEEGLVGDEPFWGRFWELPQLTAEQKGLLLRVKERLYDDLVDFGKSPQRYGLIHADLIVDNLLVDGSVVRVIDFDDAGFGWHLFELATVLYRRQWEPLYGVIKDSLITGYRSVRPLSDDHLAYLPLFMMARSLTYLGWTITRPEAELRPEVVALRIQRCCDTALAYLREGD